LHQAHADLAEIGKAFDGVGSGAGARQGREEDGDQHGDDADHDEEFDEGKRGTSRSWRGIANSPYQAGFF